ncbi:hypothetical protein NST99_19585 [Paenibacillus sp. FSL L8-0470]|uniref:hypothetical protein n=1 Tax=unclassified Paenibacillus TaxID=185978 RepID=UPI0030F937BE
MEKTYDVNPGRTTHRSTKKKTGMVLGLIIILILLAVSNPTRADFVDYAMNRPDEIFKVGESGAIMNQIAKSLLDSLTLRENFILFSVYSVPDVKDNTHFIGDIQEKKKYLGFFKIIFIEL